MNEWMNECPPFSIQNGNKREIVGFLRPPLSRSGSATRSPPPINGCWSRAFLDFFRVSMQVAVDWYLNLFIDSTSLEDQLGSATRRWLRLPNLISLLFLRFQFVLMRKLIRWDSLDALQPSWTAGLQNPIRSWSIHQWIGFGNLLLVMSAMQLG